MHSVCDKDTKNVVKQLRYRAINTGCPTLWMLISEKCANSKKKADNAIISVSGYTDQVDLVQGQKMIDCVLRNYAKVFAWIQTVSDEKYLDSLDGTDSIEHIYSLESYAEILDKGNIDYIGTRLHGGVFALQYNCRTIVVFIDQRAKGFHEDNNFPTIDRNDIHIKLDEMVNSKWETAIKIDTEAIATFINQFL